MHQADIVEMLLHDHIGVQRVHLVAHGYGGIVAQELLHRHNNEAFSRPAMKLATATLLNAPLVPHTQPQPPLFVSFVWFMCAAVLTRALQFTARVTVLTSRMWGPLLSWPLSGPATFAKLLLRHFAPPVVLPASELHELFVLHSYKQGGWLLGKVGSPCCCLAQAAAHARAQMLRYGEDQEQYSDRWTNALVDADGTTPVQLVFGVAPATAVYGTHTVLSELARKAPHIPQIKLAGSGGYPHIEQPVDVARAVATLVGTG